MSRRTPDYLYYQMKVNLIKQILAKEIKITDAAVSIGKSRQILHRWMKIYLEYGEQGLMYKKPGPKNGYAWNRSPEDVENFIIELAFNNPFLGPYPLSEKYEELTGHHIDQSTVYRILKRNNSRYGRSANPLPHKKPTLYVKGYPGEEVQLDTCYPFGRSRKTVVFDAIDDFSRWPVAKLYQTRESRNAIDFLHYLVSRVPFRILVIRTDRGKEFSSEFTAACEALGIKHIRNRGYSPEHNGKIERYHRTFKEDLVHMYFSFEAEHHELQYLLELWLKHFRFKRRHTGLGMERKTPAQRLIEYYLSESNESVNLILQQNKKCQIFFFALFFLHLDDLIHQSIFQCFFSGQEFITFGVLFHFLKSLTCVVRYHFVKQFFCFDDVIGMNGNIGCLPLSST